MRSTRDHMFASFGWDWPWRGSLQLSAIALEEGPGRSSRARGVGHWNSDDDP